MVSRSVRKKVVRTVFVAVCVLGIAGGVPAMAGVVQPDDGAGIPLLGVGTSEGKALDVVLSRETSMLELSVQGAEASPARMAVLSCRPVTGSHPAPRKACEQLRAAGGNPTAIPSEASACTTEYAPVTVTAKGTWRGEQVLYRGRFDNRCEAVRQTGGVLFNF